MPGLYTVADYDDIKDVEQQVHDEIVSRAKNQLSGVSQNEDLHVRDILPNEDLDQDDANNVNTWGGGTREWTQGGLTADTQNQVYEIDASGNADDKIIGIFAVSSFASDVITKEIEFVDGTGSMFERLMFQEARTLTEGEYALMRNPVVFNQGKDALIHQYPDTDGTDHVVYHGLVAEKAGTTLGTRSQEEDSAAGAARQPL